MYRPICVVFPLYLMMRNTTTSFSHHDLTHGDTIVISDGDAKTISRLNSEHPYGTDIEIQVSTLLILFILW